MHLFLEYFGIPRGAVWSNVLAEPLIFALTLLVMWPFRHHLMRRFVAFHHAHKTAHLKSLEAEDGKDSQ